MFRLEGVIVSKGYGDFLAASLPLNKHHFDYLVVVTTADDEETRKVCEHWNVHCLCEPRLDVEGGGFRKGVGINAGLGVLSKQGWVAHLDADIVLPPRFRDFFQLADLDPTYIYGCDRLMVPSFEAWHDFLIAPLVQAENRVFIHPRPFPVGVRIAPEPELYTPIGFIQIWNPAASGICLYDEEHTTAGRGDMTFAHKWARKKRGFLPEVFVYHLESEKAPMGVNWAGRKTKRFGPPARAELTDTIVSEFLTNEARMHAAIRT